jgi:hypothetical protein
MPASSYFILTSDISAVQGARTQQLSRNDLKLILFFRRYNDLLKMVKNYNPEFDERKYWAYGCQCLILGKQDFAFQPEQLSS